MNVMTVGDVMDTQLPACSNPQDTDSQGFASELSRASNTDKADASGRAEAPNKTSVANQPDDRQDGVKNDKSKDIDPQAVLLQGAIPVIVPVQPDQAAAAAQAGEQNAAPVVAVQAAAVANVQIVTQAVAPAQNQAVQEPVSQNTVLPDTAQSGSDAQAQPIPADAAATEDKAVAFANQALQEIETLQKAAVSDTKQAQPAAQAIQPAVQQMQPAVQEMQPVAVQQPTSQESKDDSQQTTQTEAVQAAVETNVSQAVQLTDDQKSQGDKKDNASQYQKQDANAVAQPQPVWSNTGGVAASQFKVPQPEPAVQGNIATTIIDNISTAVDKGKTEMVVQLKPEHLGGLEITLSMGENGMTAKMVTSQENVQNMIHNQIGMLQESLREKGIPVVHMEVVYDQTQNSANFSHNGSGSQWASQQGNGNGGSYKDAEESVNYYNFMSSYDVLAEHGGSVEFSA